MIKFEPVHVLLSIGSFKIYTWGFFFVISFLVSFFLARRAVKGKLEENHFLNLALLILVGILAGTRLLYVLLHFSYYSNEPMKIFAFSEGGSSSWGGFLAILFVWLYARKHKLNFPFLLDLLAPYVALGLALGRIGCFLNWCCYGIQTNVPWAIKTSGDVPRHPTQLYLFVANLTIFFILLGLQKKKEQNKKFFDGSIFLLFLLYYSVARFFIDFLRAYEASHYFAGLVISQWFCLAFIVFSIALLLKRKRFLKT
ncbi:MAG: prolipoprotein diacylglyceryl transferase [Candidatus Pacearchaeota archaeon]